MATLYKYSILINFANRNVNLSGQPRMNVPYSKTHFDTFCFNASSIRIYAERYIRIQDDEVSLYHKHHSINFQIQKAIEYYYVTCPVYTHVQAIYIRIKTDSKKAKFSSYTAANRFNEPLSKRLKGNNEWFINPTDIQPMLNEDTKAYAYRIILSYCLKSATENTDFAKFSNLWRAFNATYRYGSHSSTDKNGLNHIENIIIQNYQHLTKCGQYIATLRGTFPSLRIYQMIHNHIQRDRERFNLRTHQHGQVTYSLLTQYRDERIINSFSMNLSFNSGALCNYIQQLTPNHLVDIQNYHSHHLSPYPVIRDDAELLSFFITKYAYFLRNTLFHGAVGEPSFKLGETQEQKELGMAKLWLENLIKDMLNNHLI